MIVFLNSRNSASKPITFISSFKNKMLVCFALSLIEDHSYYPLQSIDGMRLLHGLGMHRMKHVESVGWPSMVVVLIVNSPEMIAH